MSLVPTRWLVQQRLQALLDTLTYTDSAGDSHALQDAVFIGKNVMGENSKNPPPVLSILESPQADIALFAGEDMFERKDTWVLLINGAYKEDPRYPGEDGHYFAAAVQQHLSRVVAQRSGGRGPTYPEHYLLGNIITNLEVAPPVVRLPENVQASPVGYFFLPIRVGIAASLDRLFTEVPDA